MEQIANPNSLLDMQLVQRILDCGSISKAARSLGISPSALSRQLSRVEQRLGVQLFERTTRRLRATSAGVRYREHADQILSAVASAEEEIREENVALRGTIVVTAPTLFGNEVLAPLVAPFLRKFPEICIELLLEDAFSDLVRDRIDLAIRLAPRLIASELLVRRLCEIEVVLVASPAYLKTAPPLMAVGDLSRHQCLEMRGVGDPGIWRFDQADKRLSVPVSGSFVSTSPLSIYRAARDGLGIAHVPRYLVNEDLEKGVLVQVLKKVELPRRTVFALQPPGRRAPRRVVEFVEYLSGVIEHAVGQRVLGNGSRAVGAVT